MIDILRSGDKIILVGVAETPIKGSRDRYSVKYCWIAPSVWQSALQLDDGRWVAIPPDSQDLPGSQSCKNAELVIK